MAIFNPNKWKPTDKQKQFMNAVTRYICYGGAKSGGKTWAVDFKSCCFASAYPGIRIIIFRQRLTDVKKNHLPYLKKFIGDSARWSDTVLCFYWKNGSIIQLGFFEADNDWDHWNGQEYQIVCIDEATQFTYEHFTMLCTLSRGGADKGWPERIYLTCNPGGVGHQWVKRLFIDKNYAKNERPEDYTFIPASVRDNPHVGKEYEHTLALLPERLRRAYLDGVWDNVTGQFFNEWSEKIHVVNPFPIPADWRRYFTMDYGLDMLAAYWVAIDFENNAYVYRELYQGNDETDRTGPGLIVSDAAQKILQEEKNAKDNNIYIRYAPPDLWSKDRSSGKSQVEEFAENGLVLSKSDNTRTDGWMQMHEWLRVFKGSDGKMTSRLKVFSNCRFLIENMPALQFDTKKPNDAAKVPHKYTHAPDSIRYLFIMRPFGPAISEKKPEFAFEEMGEEWDKQHNPYKGYFGGEVTESYLSGRIY